MHNPMLRENCRCKTRSRPRSAFDRGGRRRLGMREEAVAPHRPRGSEPVVLAGGPGTKCEPFITVQKDPERFAACNALADEIGELNDPKKAFELLEEAIGDEVNEVFGVLTLDLYMRMKGLGLTGRGEPSSVMAPIVPTLQAAVADGAHAAIIFHVHPSGIEAMPSQADIDTTDEFVEAFDRINIPLLDHIIVGGDKRKRSYYSFREDDAL